MSVLSFPRIYFQGFMCWDPPTGNNNDQFPTYAYDKAELNWGYLNDFSIDRNNFGTTFRPWFCKSREYVDPNTGNKKHSPPGEWNMFGTNGCYFVQFEDAKQGIVRHSRITGGATAMNSPVSGDPLINKPIELIGDLFGSSEAPRPGRLVDNNPATSYSSQIYFNSMRFGDDGTGISGPCYRRMHSRFIGTMRNPNLPSAGHTAVTWQTCFPANKGLVIHNAGNKSSLLTALQKKIDSGEAQGVMVRFNTYLSLYYQNGYFNASAKKPETLKDTEAMYIEAFKPGGNQFVNPCYSRIVGTIGLWYGDELASVPEGRFLATSGIIKYANPLAKADTSDVLPRLSGALIHGGPQPLDEPSPPQAAGANINIPQPDPKKLVQLGVTLIEVDRANSVISIDALNTFPETYWQGDKVDLGNVTLAIKNGAGNYTPIVPVMQPPRSGYTLAYQDYDQGSYERNCGIIDFKFDPALYPQIRDGTLVVRVPAKDGSGPTDALTERPWSAQTDDRGLYLNETETTSFNVSVFLRGQRAANAKLMIAKYAPALTHDPLSYVNTKVIAISAGGPQIVNVTNGTTTTVSTDGTTPIRTNVTVVDVDAKGVAKVTIAATANGGLPVLMFYPFGKGEPLPTPQYDFDYTIPSGVSYYTTVRVLPFDDAFVDQFVQLWNSTHDPAQAWNFIYSNILYLYDMIYPVMLRFVPLGNRQRVEAAVDQVLTLIAPSYFAESTLAMPITRDMSAGKRTVLQLWGGLVKRGYPPQPITAPVRASL